MKIISGGQTGADLGGLEGAKKAMVQTGGMAPRGYRTENGSNYELDTVYGLSASHDYKYNHRTEHNIRTSDATVIFAGNIHSAGTQLTITTCRNNYKPYLCNPKVKELVSFIKYHNVNILNVAGNRESVCPGIQKLTCDAIYKTLRKLNEKEISD